MKKLEFYISQFKSLRRAHNLGGAPHKPILLLAVFSLIRKGFITSNKIEITPELVLEFKEYWNKFVITPHTQNFALPFFHMGSEPFWELVAKLGEVIPVTSSNSVKSFRSLQEAIACAELDKGLFETLLDKANNLVLSEWIVDHYFSALKNKGLDAGYNLFSQLESEILNDDKVIYQKRIENLQSTLNPDDFKEEVFVRCGIFKREIPKIYNYQCAISGMRVESINNIQMVDACHIVPFAVSHDDTIKNGICLSPNLHRAFDRGLLTITLEYKVKISKRIVEHTSPFSLMQFEGKEIALPIQVGHLPDAGNLRVHFEEVFLK